MAAPTVVMRVVGMVWKRAALMADQTVVPMVVLSAGLKVASTAVQTVESLAV